MLSVGPDLKRHIIDAIILDQLWLFQMRGLALAFVLENLLFATDHGWWLVDFLIVNATTTPIRRIYDIWKQADVAWATWAQIQFEACIVLAD